MIHPWHDIEIGDNFEELKAVIEISEFSKVKYELDKDTGLLVVDRVLPSSMVYPANYGFFPQTYCEDKDPLDLFLFCQKELVPMSLVDVRPIGLVGMNDQGEQDDKLLAVVSNDPMYSHVKDIKDMPPHVVKQLVNFLETYKVLENKKVEVGEVRGREDAIDLIKQSMIDYRNHFKK